MVCPVVADASPCTPAAWLAVLKVSPIRPWASPATDPVAKRPAVPAMFSIVNPVPALEPVWRSGRLSPSANGVPWRRCRGRAV
jgi:hypothetical protein